MTTLEREQLERDFEKKMQGMVDKLKRSRLECIAQGLTESAVSLQQAIATLEGFKTPAQFLGWIGGNTPTKPGSRRRGRPRKAVQ